MSEELIQIHWTCGSIDEARAISRLLVEKKLVACASIIPWVESIFPWDDQIDVQQESKVIFKTGKELFSKVKEFLLEHANYEVPEILALPVVDANPAYSDWVFKSLEQNKDL